jgi:hypothetical protein
MTFRDLLPLFMLLAIAGGAIALALYVTKSNKQRTSALAAYATSKGLYMVRSTQIQSPEVHLAFFESLRAGPSPDIAFLQRFGLCEPFDVGNARRMENLIAGTNDGMDWYLFDYFYQTQTSDTIVLHNFAILAARVPLQFPTLQLKPETTFSKAGQHLGLADIKVELDEFNQKYFIRCDDQKKAFDILCPGIIEFLMALPARLWQTYGNYVFVVQPTALTAEMCYEVTQEIAGLIRLLPEYVKQDLACPPTWTNAFD